MARPVCAVRMRLRGEVLHLVVLWRKRARFGVFNSWLRGAHARRGRQKHKFKFVATPPAQGARLSKQRRYSSAGSAYDS